MNISSVISLGQNTSVPTDAPANHVVKEEDRAVIQAVKAVNAAELFGNEHELTFRVDQKMRRVIARIVDRKTGELVREIPAEYVTRLAEGIKGK